MTVATPVQRRPWPLATRGLEVLRGDRVLQTALALIVVQLAVRAWGVYGGWFVLDDFGFIARMGHDGLSPIAASTSYNGHVMPAAMYLSWLNHVLAPWQWWLPATELLLLQALADLAMLRLLVALHGRRPGILPPLALFLFTVITLEGAMWWAAGINLLPLEISFALALTAHLRYLRTSRLRHAVSANGWVVAGMLFNERSTLIYLAMGVLTLVWFAEGYGWGRIGSAIRGRTAALALYAGTGAVYLGIYALAGRSHTFPHSPSYPTYGVAETLVVNNYVPALVGGPLRWHHFGKFVAAAPGDAIMLCSLVVVGLVLNELVRHRARAARALALPVVFVVVDIALVLRTQYLPPGQRLDFDYRFTGELAAVTAVALAGMALPIAGALSSSARASASELLDHPRRVAALVIVTTALALVSSIGLTRAWHSDDRAEDWVLTVTRSLAASPDPVPLADRVVPAYVMASTEESPGLASRLFVREPNADWVSVNTDSLRAIDDQGRLRPALVAAQRAAVPGPVPGCGYRIDAAPTTIPLDGPATGSGLWLRIGYLSTGASPVRVTLGDRSVSTTINAGVHALFVRAGSSFDSVQISGLSDAVFLCTDDVTVGVPQPNDPEGASS